MQFMLRGTLNILGRMLVAMPEVIPRALTVVMGALIYYASAKRRRVLISNLHHAFPDKGASWHRRIARESCRRMAETALFVLAAPQMSDARLRQRFRLDSDFVELIQENNESPQPIVALVPHFSMMESLTMIPFLAEKMAIETSVIYRPFDSRVIEKWAQETRGRHGMSLLSRKAGYNQAMAILRRKGTVAILFDQNTGDHGVLTTCFGRVASTTELPGLLSIRFNALNLVVFTERTGFWRGVIRAEPLGVPSDSLETLFRGNLWLEKILADEHYCADWLWLHDRWRNQDRPERRLRLQAKKNALEEDRCFRHLQQLPRNTRFWIRMPNWLGDVVMATPLLLALRKSRPDAEITLLIQPHFADLWRQFGVADKIIPLPKKGAGYFRFFHTLSGHYPDTQIQFTQSLRGDIEAWLCGAPQRFGIERGRKRRLLTHCWKIPADTDEHSLHQLHLWTQYLRHFGLEGEIPLHPLSLNCGKHPPAPKKDGAIGMICGTENTPDKRWPVAHWRKLIGLLDTASPVYLFGTARDSALCAEVAAGFPSGKVIDMSGKTSLLEFAEALRGLSLLVSNDTGGMHMANALGTPVIGLFGPTNPVRTGPVFNAPVKIMQPDGCPQTGGMPMDRISAESVAEAIAELNTAVWEKA